MKSPERVASGEQERQIIVPPNILRQKTGGLPRESDRIPRADAAAAAVTLQQERYLDSVVGQATASWRACVTGVGDQAAFYRALHELRGIGTNFSYPLISEFAHEVCMILDAFGPAPAYHRVIDVHVQSIVAVLARQAKGDGGPLGLELRTMLGRLRKKI